MSRDTRKDVDVKIKLAREEVCAIELNSDEEVDAYFEDVLEKNTVGQPGPLARLLRRPGSPLRLSWSSALEATAVPSYVKAPWPDREDDARFKAELEAKGDEETLLVLSLLEKIGE